MIYSCLSSSEAIKRLYLERKSLKNTFSLGYICSKAEIPSKGYLSDVMKGKRTLNQCYVKGLIKVFSLRGTEAEFFKLLVLRDHEKSAKISHKLFQRLESLRRESQKRQMSIPENLYNPFFTIEVFCAFGLFNANPSLNDLVTYFGKSEEPKILLALECLTSMGTIVKKTSGYHLLERQFHFNKSDDGNSHFEHVETCISEAGKNVKRLFDQKTEAYFESTTSSVSKKAYITALPKLKKMFKAFINDLETDDGDELIRFNIQVYPRSGVS